MKIINILYFLFIVFLTTPVWAATYYIDPDWSGTESGTFSEPYNNITDLPSISSGDDIYFKCGTTLTRTSRWTINWSGVDSNNYSIVGAYYNNGGSPAYGVNGDGKPIIDGDDSGPSSQWDGLIFVNGQSYVQIENIKVINSEGMGAEANNSTNIIFDGIDTYNTFQSGIEFWTVSIGQIINCDVDHAGMVWPETAGTWPAALGVHNGSNGILIRGNRVHESHTEGIGLYKDAYSNIIEHNVVYATRAECIYVDHGQDMDIRYNLVYGTTDSTFWRSGSYPHRGINIDDESQYGYSWTSNIRIYGNMVAWFNNGIVVSDEFDSSPSNVYIYNNTVIDCLTSAIRFNATSSTVYVKNNIFWDIGNDDTGVAIGSPGSATLDYNLWSRDPGASYRGANDPGYDTYSSQTLASYKISGWQGMAGGDLTVTDFTIGATSDAADAGTTITGYEIGLSPTSDYIDMPYTMQTVPWLDYTSPEIGALNYIAGGELPPTSGISVDSAGHNEDSDGNTTMSVTCSLGQNSGNNRVVVLSAQWLDPSERTISSVKFDPGGVNADMTLAVSPPGSSSWNNSTQYYILDANLPSSSGSYTITVTFSDNTQLGNIGYVSFYDAKQQAPEATASQYVSSGGYIATDITTLTNTAWVIDSVMGSAPTSPTPGGAQSVVTNYGYVTNDGTRSYGMSQRDVASAGQVTNTWTGTAGSFSHCLTSWEPAATTGTGPTITAIGTLNGAAFDTSQTLDLGFGESVYILFALSEQLTSIGNPEQSRVVYQVDYPASTDYYGMYVGQQLISGTYYLKYEIKGGYTYTGSVWSVVKSMIETSDLAVSSLSLGNATMQDGDGNDLDTSLTTSGTDPGTITITVRPTVMKPGVSMVGGSASF